MHSRSKKRPHEESQEERPPPRVLEDPATGLSFEYLRLPEAEMLFEEIFVKRCYAQHGIEVSPNSTVVDGGANIGLFALWCASEAPGITLACFEPLPPILDVLRRNLAGLAGELVGGCRSVAVLPFALGSCAEDAAPFTFYPTQPGESTRHPQERLATLKRVVEASREASGQAQTSQVAVASSSAESIPSRPQPNKECGDFGDGGGGFVAGDMAVEVAAVDMAQALRDVNDQAERELAAALVYEQMKDGDNFDQQQRQQQRQRPTTEEAAVAAAAEATAAAAEAEAPTKVLPEKVARTRNGTGTTSTEVSVATSAPNSVSSSSVGDFSVSLEDAPSTFPCQVVTLSWALAQLEGTTRRRGDNYDDDDDDGYDDDEDDDNDDDGDANDDDDNAWSGVIDLLKLDVEGSELSALRGILDKDWARVRQVVVEVCDVDDDEDNDVDDDGGDAVDDYETGVDGGCGCRLDGSGDRGDNESIDSGYGVEGQREDRNNNNKVKEGLISHTEESAAADAATAAAAGGVNTTTARSAAPRLGHVVTLLESKGFLVTTEQQGCCLPDDDPDVGSNTKESSTAGVGTGEAVCGGGAAAAATAASAVAPQTAAEDGDELSGAYFFHFTPAQAQLWYVYARRV